MLDLAALDSASPLAPVQQAATAFLARFGATLPASAVHRVVLFPLLSQLRSGDHIATALLTVRSRHSLNQIDSEAMLCHTLWGTLVLTLSYQSV